MNCHSIAGDWPPEPWHSEVPPYVTSWRQATTSFILKKRTVLTALSPSHTPLPSWGRCEFHLDWDLPFHAPQILNFGSTLSTVHVTCHIAVSFPLPPVSYLSFKMQIPATLTSLLQRNPWRPSESVDWHPLIIGTETWPSDCCYEHAAGGTGGRGVLYGVIVPFYNETYLNRFRIRHVQCLCVFNVSKLFCLIYIYSLQTVSERTYQILHVPWPNDSEQTNAVWK